MQLACFWRNRKKGTILALPHSSPSHISWYPSRPTLPSKASLKKKKVHGFGLPRQAELRIYSGAGPWQGLFQGYFQLKSPWSQPIIIVHTLPIRDRQQYHLFTSKPLADYYDRYAGEILLFRCWCLFPYSSFHLHLSS